MGRLENITLADGIKLEVKYEDGTFEKPDVKEAFRKMVAATKVNETRSVLRFLFIHPSYFRAFEEFGLPFLLIPVVKNYDKFQDEIASVIRLSKETANLELSEFAKKIVPIINEVFVKPLFKWFKTSKKKTRMSEEQVKAKFTLYAFERMREFSTNKDIVKRAMKKYVSPRIFSEALALGRTAFNLISNTLTERALERYRLLAREISDDDVKQSNQTTDALLECGVITPLITVAVCMNKYCRHVEIIVSERIPEAKCGKCKNDALSATFAFINEPYLWLKHKMLDLHAFISSYIESKSTQQYINEELGPDLRCYLNAYVRNVANQKQREVDALLYSAITRKAVAIEIKVHQIRTQLPRNRLWSILREDLRQLTETLKETGLRKGCYISNLKLSDEEINSIKEDLLPKLVSSKNQVEIEIIGFTSETVFLTKLDKLISEIKE